MRIGRLVARTVIGGVFIGHGTQKLFGSFGGPGLEGTEQMMDALEMRPTRNNALAAGVTETVGGALLLVGLATPLAAASLIGVMTTAIRKVHLKNGLWNANGGYEYNLALIGSLLALVDGGPGDLSLDRALGIHETGSRWAFGSLAAGAAASTLAIKIGKRRPPLHAAGAPTGASAGANNSSAPDLSDVAGDPVTEGP